MSPPFLRASDDITSEGHSDDLTYSPQDLLDCRQSNPFSSYSPIFLFPRRRQTVVGVELRWTVQGPWGGTSEDSEDCLPE